MMNWRAIEQLEYFKILYDLFVREFGQIGAYVLMGDVIDEFEKVHTDSECLDVNKWWKDAYKKWEYTIIDW